MTMRENAQVLTFALKMYMVTTLMSLMEEVTSYRGMIESVIKLQLPVLKPVCRTAVLKTPPNLETKKVVF